MKFNFSLLVALGLSFYSCSSSDDHHAPAIQPQLPAQGQNRVATISHKGALTNVYDWELTYDAYRLTHAKGVLIGETQNAYSSVFSYSPTGVSISNMKLVNDNFPMKMQATMDNDGNIVQLTIDRDDYNFTYTDGRLTAWHKTVRNTSLGGEISQLSATLTYDAGNLVRIECVKDYNAPTIITLTPSELLNVNGLLPVALSAEFGCFGFESLYYGGMLGKPSTHLPLSASVDDYRGESYDYQLIYAYAEDPVTGNVTLCNVTRSEFLTEAPATVGSVNYGYK